MKVINFVITSCTVFTQFQVIFSDMTYQPCPQLNLQNGRVRLRSRGRVAKFRCDSMYQLVGNKTATCIRGTWDTSTPLCIRNDCPPVPKPAKNGNWAVKYKGASYTLNCNEGFKLRGSKVIYCLNRRWSDTIPVCDEILTSCDFEKEDLCGWTQNESHFMWSRHSNATPSSHVGTGPSFDHTLGQGYDGHYMYIESSSPYSENDTAQLLSPEYESQISQNACFKFWYHMHGATIGDLNIYQKLLSADTNMTKIFHKSGEQGNQWMVAIVNLTTVNDKFQIVIEAIRGQSYMSDIAVDDVQLTKGEECIYVVTKPPSQPTTQITVATSPKTTEPAIVIPKTIKPYPTFLPPPPPPTLPPLPSLPSLLPLPDQTSQTSSLPLVPPVPSLLPQSVLQPQTTQSSLPSQSSVSLPLPSVLTLAVTLSTKNISQTYFNYSTLSPNRTTLKPAIVNQTETPHLYSSGRYSTGLTVPFNSSVDRIINQTTFLKSTPSYFGNLSPTENKQFILTRPTGTSQFMENNITASQNKTDQPIHISTQMFTLKKNNQEKSMQTRTSMFYMKTNITSYLAVSTTTSFKYTDKRKNTQSQTYFPKFTMAPKHYTEHNTKAQTDIPIQRTTSLITHIKPAVKQGYRTTLEPSTKMKESKAEANVSHLSSIAGAVGGLIAVATIAALLVFVFSRRITRFKKHRDMSEDSDVRFLTSDEVLDFSLARPNDDDDDL